MKKSLIISVLFFTLLLNACSKPEVAPEPIPVIVKTIEITRPAPIVPEVDQLNLRPINWVVITPENINDTFAKMKTGEVVLFALTKDGYENLALNLSDVRSNIQQYKQIIAVYKAQF